MGSAVRVRRGAVPVAPVDIADEVEHWARLHGRHASIQFVPTQFFHGRIFNGSWVVRLTLRSNDKRLLAYQQGKVAEEPMEDVWLQVPNPKANQPIGTTGLRELPFLPLDLHQMGASGVREFLERGDMWSGRGEFRSLEQQMRMARDARAIDKYRHRERHKNSVREKMLEWRRRLFKIPLHRVGIDLKQKGAHDAGSQQDSAD